MLALTHLPKNYLAGMKTKIAKTFIKQVRVKLSTFLEFSLLGCFLLQYLLKLFLIQIPHALQKI